MELQLNINKIYVAVIWEGQYYSLAK